MNEQDERARVIRVTHFHPAEDRREELVELLRQVTARAARLPGCFGAQACSVDDSEELVAISRWQDQEALDRALASDEATLRGRLEGMLAHKPVTEHYRPIG